MPEATLSIFDPNISANSPAGSCLLKMIEGIRSSYNLVVFTAHTDLRSTNGVNIHRMPVPRKPVFLENMLFTLTSVLWDRLTRGAGLKIGTQGGFPFCDISYAHCCHQLFLTRYRASITGGFVARNARLLNHYWSAAMEAVAFQHARLIVVPSSGLAGDITSAYGPVIERKIRAIANPIDCAAFSAKPPVGEHPFTFAFCALGNFEWKGLPLILEAMAGGIPARLQVIGGSSSEIDRYRKLAQSLNVAEQVSFVGLQKDIRPYLWNSHAFVFPSIYETFSLVCFQAAAAGLALIATDLHGLEELLQPEISGWRIERTVESVGQAMRAALAKPACTSEMGCNAQALAKKYDESAFQARWLELLGELLPAT